MQIGIKQSQILNLTPELPQSISILQYSAHELIDFLQQQAVENPFLEVKEYSHPGFAASTSMKPSFKSLHSDKEYDPITRCSDTSASLERHLLEQIMTLRSITPLQKKIVTFLISHLNHYGFLDIEPAFAARFFSVPMEEIEQSVNILQSLDPTGVGAKDIVDCLLIQMRSQQDYPQLAYRIVEDHLEDLAENRYRKIAALNRVRVQEVQEAADYIKTLNPRPCSFFQDEMVHYITPDVIVEYIEKEYVIIINDSMMPTLSINEFYRDKLRNSKSDEAKKFLKQKYQEVMILMNGISQRKLTLYKVTQAILNKQRDFLQYGKRGLKPMTLRDISEQLDIHESTVSRATSNKYTQTSHGLFTLKSLFSVGFDKTNNSNTDSSFNVKEKIKSLINSEDKQKPFSDQTLVQLLEQSGTLISRRTVAKYREQIGIPASSKRRRFE